MGDITSSDVERRTKKKNSCVICWIFDVSADDGRWPNKKIVDAEKKKLFFFFFCLFSNVIDGNFAPSPNALLMYYTTYYSYTHTGLLYNIEIGYIFMSICCQSQQQMELRQHATVERTRLMVHSSRQQFCAEIRVSLLLHGWYSLRRMCSSIPI